MFKEDLIQFRESLARVASQTGFFDSFYDRFMGQSEEITAIFVNRDMAQLKHKLKETLQILADTAEGRPGFGLYVEMLGRIHQRLNVTRAHFDMWREALLDTIAVYDEQYNLRVRLAWQRVIDSVIDQLFDNLRDPQKEVS